MSGIPFPRHVLCLAGLLACTAAIANPLVIRHQTGWKAVEGCARAVSVMDLPHP